MGKIAERLSRRKSPEFDLVRRIVKVAARLVADHDDEEELSNLLEDALRSRSPASFHELIGHVYDEADPRRDADELLDQIVMTVQALIEDAPRADGKVDYLLAVPLSLTHDVPAWRLTLSQDQAGKVARVLKEHALVHEDAELSILPQLLGPGQADYVREGTAYRMRTALASGEFEQATALLTDDFADQGLRPSAGIVSGQGEPGAPKISFAVLVAVVRCDDAEPFPLEMHMRHAFEEAYPEDGEGGQAVLDEAYADEQQILAQASVDLAAALGVSQASVLDAPNGWYAGVEAACIEERKAGAEAEIARLAAAHAGGDATKLRFGELRLSPGVAEVDLYTADRRASVGLVQWQAMVRESPDECLDELEAALLGEGLRRFEE